MRSSNSNILKHNSSHWNKIPKTITNEKQITHILYIYYTYSHTPIGTNILDLITFLN